MGVTTHKLTNPLLRCRDRCAGDQIVTIEDRRCYNASDSINGKMGEQMAKKGCYEF